MKTLVTGATGHLGANLVRRLCARGDAVRVLLRPGSPTEAIEGLEVERVVGDLGDRDALRAAVDGCEALFHCAAMVSTREGDREALMKVNVEGTRFLMDAALDAGVKRAVHTSSFGAVSGRNGEPSTEDDWLDPFEPVMDYERSKAHSEIPVFQAAARGLEVCVVNPSAIVGPHDYRPSLVGNTILEFARRRMRAYVPGGFDWVSVHSVVDGHLSALERGRPGERYLLTGEVHSIDQILDWLEEFTGVPRPRLRIPPRFMQWVAIVKDWVERRFFPQVMPRFNYHSIRLLTSGKHGDCSKAQEELGYRVLPVRDAFAEAVQWFRASGRISGETAASDSATRLA